MQWHSWRSRLCCGNQILGAPRNNSPRRRAHGHAGAVPVPALRLGLLVDVVAAGAERRAERGLVFGEAPNDDRRDRGLGAVFRPRDLDVAVAEGRHRGEGLLHGDGRVFIIGVRRRAPRHRPGVSSGEGVKAAGGLQEERGEGPPLAAPRHGVYFLRLPEEGCVALLALSENAVSMSAAPQCNEESCGTGGMYKKRPALAFHARALTATTG